MYHATDLDYLQTRKIKKGEHSLLPQHQAFVGWIGDRLGVKVLDFSLYAQGNAIQIVHVNIERKADAERLDTPDNRRLIRQHFHEYIKGHDAAGDATKTSVHSAVNGVFPETLIHFCSLEDVDVAELSCDLLVLRITKESAHERGARGS